MNFMGVRSELIYRRTYSRPLDEDAGIFEDWDGTIDRVILHQRWLWERSLGRDLNDREGAELYELRDLMRQKKVAVSGRTMWLGGTDVAMRREASQFNCSHLNAETVHDMVDVLWLLLQGCGVGATAVPGTLSGFSQPAKEISNIRSEITIEQFKAGRRGHEDTRETWNPDTRTWTITIGDSAEGWAKSIGKLLAHKYPADHLVFDFSQIRPAGIRLKGYGWISGGDELIAKAYEAIARILSQRASMILRRTDIEDIINWLGTILSSRRSSEILLEDAANPDAAEFAVRKKGIWSMDGSTTGLEFRSQSNNTLLHWSKPSLKTIRDQLDLMWDAGGSEPGIANGAAALNRAPWFKGFNPCAEILLANKGFCNLVELVLPAFRNDWSGMVRAMQLVARANYRQSCVDLQDGILQSAWDQINEFLHLCGAGITGVVQRPDLTPYDFRQLNKAATVGAFSMADDLGRPRPKAVTTVKPSGTISKVMGVTEGVHMPEGQHIFNNVIFSNHDETLPLLRSAGYRVFPHPSDPTSSLVTFPVDWSDVRGFKKASNGKMVNAESAISQLNRYKMLMDNYVDHNCSITVSYSEDEIPQISEWLDRNWDSYVAVAFMPRFDNSLGAKDLGFPYLPQEVVTEFDFKKYTANLSPVDLSKVSTAENLEGEGCAGGACPIR